MGREIKFRAWNAMAKGMLHFGNPIAIADDVDRYGTFFESLEKKMYIGGRYELMQFTGLHDKNDKEIYEGDIVKMHYFSEGLSSNLGVFEKDNTITGNIQYRQDFATYVVNTKDLDYPISDYCQEPSEELEVIEVRPLSKRNAVK